MNLRELRALNRDQLAKELENSHRELFNLRFRLETRQLANHREIPKVRRTIARIMTIMRERELGIAKE